MKDNFQKGFALPMIIGIIALVVIVAGAGVYLLSNSSKNDTAMMEKQKMEQMAMEGKQMMEENMMMEKPSDAEAMEGKEGGEMPALSGVPLGSEGMTKYTGTILAGKSAPLLDYNKADYDAAIASDKLVVLYFYANWCAICKAETANALYPVFNELTTDKVVGIRINYKDSDTDKDEENLARQYGIPYQHTKVFVKNGKQILKAPDSWDKARYMTEINKAIAQ